MSSKSTSHQAKAQPTTKQHKIFTRQKISYVAFLTIWAFLSMTISQYAIGLPMFWCLGDRFSQPLWTCLYYALTYILALLLTVVLPPYLVRRFSKHTKKPVLIADELQVSRTELGLAGLPTLIDVGLAPIAYFVYLLLSSIFTSIMSAFSWFNATETQNVGFGYFVTGLDRMVAMLALVLIAPVAEEIIMRGWLYGKLRNKLHLITAMLITSFIFGLLHGQWNVSVGVFALSLVLCGLREITGTIWSGMLLHILSNGIAFYLLYIAF